MRFLTLVGISVVSMLAGVSAIGGVAYVDFYKRHHLGDIAHDDDDANGILARESAQRVPGLT
ncbi:hypothetical protein BG003_011041 [Podila horticola]|nr:hypothetical protein BG003_011041 [Podila horticola]